MLSEQRTECVQSAERADAYLSGLARREFRCNVRAKLSPTRLLYETI
jgi:hypothetical protein